MATVDKKDKTIPEVPHLENVTGVEKIPVSAAGGVPRYVEIKQIATPISLDYIDSKFNPLYEIWLISYNKSLPSDIVGNLIYGKVKDFDSNYSSSELKERIVNLPCFITSCPSMEQAEEIEKAILLLNDTFSQPELTTEIRKK